MSNLTDQNLWTANIRQIEPGDRVIGGANAAINLCLSGINNRVVFVKNQLAEAVETIGTNKANATTKITAGNGLTGGGDLSANRTITLGTPSKITASTTNSVGTNTHTHEIDNASTTVAGVVKLNDTLSSQSASEALTAKQGRVLALKIDEKLGSSGTQTLSGSLKVGVANIWHKLEFPTEGGGVWIFETNPKSSLDTEGSVRLNLKYLENGTSRYISYPHLAQNEAIAYQSWVSSQIETANYVALSGDQTISGTKTFSGSLKTTGNITTGGNIDILKNNKTGGFGTGATDVFLYNSASSKYLQLKDNGELAYSGDKIILRSMLSDAINSPSSSTVASSKAVKTAYDKAQTAQTAAEQATPSGTIAFMAGNRAPTGWLKANGAAVSRTTYANLFAAIGTTYGAGDGRTTFNLPDLRGEFARGFDDGRGVDSGRAFGSWQSDAMQQFWGSIQFHEMIAGTPSDGIFRTEQTPHERTYHNSGSGFHTKVILDASTVVRTAAETRPRNLALLACIKI
ncbi:phage tail protein [Neisseriaceae bacterium B1]